MNAEHHDSRDRETGWGNVFVGPRNSASSRHTVNRYALFFDQPLDMVGTRADDGSKSGLVARFSGWPAYGMIPPIEGKSDA
jgi:hypothetical protein